MCKFGHETPQIQLAGVSHGEPGPERARKVPQLARVRPHRPRRPFSSGGCLFFEGHVQRLVPACPKVCTGHVLYGYKNRHSGASSTTPVFEAHRLLYHSTLDLRVIQKKKKKKFHNSRAYVLIALGDLSLREAASSAKVTSSGASSISTGVSD